MWTDGDFVSWEQPTWDAVADVHGMLTAPHGAVIDLIVVENFIISASTLRKTRAGTHATIESIGALRYLARTYGVEFDDSQTAVEKKFSTAAKLKALGWYKASPGGHQNDAARHLLIATVRRGLIDPATFLTEE